MDINQEIAKGFTPLLFSSANPDPAVTAFLLENGADPTMENEYGQSIAMQFCQNGTIEHLKQLIEKDVDLMGRDPNGYNALAYSLDSKNYKIATLLLKMGIEYKNPGFDPLFHSLLSRDFQLASEILKRDIPVTSTFQDGWTPIMMALKYFPTEIFYTLIEKGASLEGKTNRLWTPLHWAAGYSTSDTVQTLIEKNLEIDALTDMGGTSLIIALANDRPDNAAVLIDNGANVNISDSNGIHPLFFALGKMEYSLIEKMVKSGADLSVQNEDGKTLKELAEDIEDQRLLEILK